MTKFDMLKLICLFIIIIAIISIPFGYVQGIYIFWIFGALFAILRGYEVFS